jgi:Bacterial PH domain
VADSVRVGSEPVTFRPRRIRRVCWVLAPVVVIVFSVLATVLARPVGEGGGVFGPSDRVAMIALGVLVALGILVFTRPKVTADRAGVKIQNVIGGYELPWEVVRSVRFERGNPWLSLELHDDDVVAVMAIQAADKEYAVAGARALRALLAEHQRGGDCADRT